jgi:uncharacterized protein (TIGR03437 family)
MIRALVFLLSASSFAWGQPYTISTVAGGIPPGTPATAVGVSIGDPPRVAVDENGNLFFAASHSLFRVDRAGMLARIAGNGRAGITGDGGPATNAQLLYPVGIAVDGSGNIYFTERDAHVIRKVAANGTVSTIAGTGTAGFSGDRGPATLAQLNTPTGLDFDNAGNLYVADTNNDAIRRIAPEGTITTVAGNNGRGYGGDGGSAIGATLNAPQGVAVDASGTLYIADTFNHRIRSVATGGGIATFAGNGFPGFSGDNNPASGATLLFPTDVAADRQGNILIADQGNNRIRRVAKGTITTIAGGPADVQVTEGFFATAVRLNGPTGIAVDGAGNVYFAEGSIGLGSGLAVGDNRIWKVGTDGVLTAVAGNGLNSFSGDLGPAANAQIDTPAQMAFDGAGNLYFADSKNHRIRKIGINGTVITVAGNALPGFAGDAGPATKAELNNPTGVAIDFAGNLYIADTGNNRVRKVYPNGLIGTYAGNGNAALFGDGGLATDAALQGPRGLITDFEGNLYIADTLNHRVRVVRGDGTIDSVAGVDAPLSFPSAVALDTAGNLFIADQGNHRIRKLAAGSSTLTTVEGTDSAATPRGLTADGSGNIYYSDAAKNVIRRIAPDGTVATIAGTGSCCYAGDGGPAASAFLNQPWGLAADTAGRIWIADAGNNAIRVLSPATQGSFIRAITNGASNLTGSVAPGEIVTIYGSGIGPAAVTTSQANAAGVFPTEITGYQVTFGGLPAPLLYASAAQVSAIVPYGVTGSRTQVVVRFQGQSTPPVTLALEPAQPGIFTADSSGSGQARAINQDGGANGPSRPAAAGSLLTVFLTGEGQTSPGGTDGKLADSPAPMPQQAVAVTIGGKAASVQYAGGVPGVVAGVMQLNVQVPAGVSGSAVPLVVTVGGAPSQAGVTVAVGN